MQISYLVLISECLVIHCYSLNIYHNYPDDSFNPIRENLKVARHFLDQVNKKDITHADLRTLDYDDILTETMDAAPEYSVTDMWWLNWTAPTTPQTTTTEVDIPPELKDFMGGKDTMLTGIEGYMDNMTSPSDDLAPGVQDMLKRWQEKIANQSKQGLDKNWMDVTNEEMHNQQTESLSTPDIFTSSHLPYSGGSSYQPFGFSNAVTETSANAPSHLEDSHANSKSPDAFDESSTTQASSTESSESAVTSDKESFTTERFLQSSQTAKVILDKTSSAVVAQSSEKYDNSNQPLMTHVSEGGSLPNEDFLLSNLKDGGNSPAEDLTKRKLLRTTVEIASVPNPTTIMYSYNLPEEEFFTATLIPDDPTGATSVEAVTPNKVTEDHGLLFGEPYKIVPIKPTQKPPLQLEMEQYMTQHKVGPLSAGLVKMMEIAAMKNQTHLDEAVSHLIVFVNRETMMNRYWFLGEQIKDGIIRLTSFVGRGGPQIKNGAAIFYRMLHGRRQSIGQDINLIFDYADTLYTQEEINSLSKALAEFRDYPRGVETPPPFGPADEARGDPPTPYEMAEMLLGSLYAPMRRLDRTDVQKRLVDAMNKAIDARFGQGPDTEDETPTDILGVPNLLPHPQRRHWKILRNTRTSLKKTKRPQCEEGFNESNLLRKKMSQNKGQYKILSHSSINKRDNNTNIKRSLFITLKSSMFIENHTKSYILSKINQFKGDKIISSTITKLTDPQSQTKIKNKAKYSKDKRKDTDYKNSKNVPKITDNERFKKVLRRMIKKAFTKKFMRKKINISLSNSESGEERFLKKKINGVLKL